jgi:hypothetical protein
MEIKELKTVTVAKLEGDAYAVDGHLCKSFRAAVDRVAAELGVERTNKGKPAKAPPKK